MTDKNPWADIIGPCYTRASFARALGWTEPGIAAAAASRQVLELLTDDGVLLYPAFQVNHGQVVEGLTEVLKVLSSGTRSRWTWAQWLNAPVDDDSGEEAPSAIDQLRDGRLPDVVRDAQHAAASWSL